MYGAPRTFLLTLLLLLTAAVLTAGEVPSTPVDGRPLNAQQWTQYDWNASSGETGAARFERRDGFLQIRAESPNDARFVRELTVEPHTIYHFTCQSRSENIGSGLRGAGISVVDILEGSPDSKGRGNDWQLLEFYGKTGPDQNKISVTVGIGGYGSMNSGTVWFRDITVKKVGSVPPGIRVAALQPPVAAEPAAPVGQKRSGGMVIATLGCFGGLLAWWGVILRRRSGSAGQRITVNPLPTPVLQERVAGRDVASMAALSAAGLLISLLHLGGHVAPETGWRPTSAGQSVTIELGREVDLSRIYYYCGINDSSGDGSRYSLAARNPAGNFIKVASFTKDDTYIWKFNEVDVRTSAVRLTAETPGGRLNEIAFVEKGKRVPLAGVGIVEKSASSPTQGTPENLLDEQSSFEYAPSFWTGFYFDEIYHARTAWEMLNRIEPYETTHPPLGKLLISSGIALFGMNPFGWRIMGALFGVALVPLMYLFALKLFRNWFYAFCAAFLMLVEFMRFAQSRVAVIDVYGVFFILLMYYFILDLFPERDGSTRRSVNRALLLAGTTFGIGAACKWIALYAGCGMVLLVVVRTVADLQQHTYSAEHGMAGFLLRRIGTCLLAFGLLPGLIYLLAYLPYLLLDGPGHGLTDVVRLQAHMLHYHRMLQASHPFSSAWWSWPLDLHPMWMYTGVGLPAGSASSIVSFGNPAIFWLGIPAVATAVYCAVQRREPALGVVLTALVCQYLPWVGINRLAFIYHFFSSVPFLILCIVAAIRSAELRNPRFRTVTWGYMGIAAVLFILFYPVLSGMQVPQAYIASLTWLPTWIF